ncbi:MULTISPECIES: anhydro-N-acetylmuramic acid kinase [Crocosphaera]|uniref:Anhydro-N-acetylmuramic acid kinase n=3 Tax=Crocosphaera watsonii TaxID=263511 RepID=G5J2U7_CROWT|nr:MULTISPECIES: anhydro-N-acetylmuramic acid kinase [Crocosphaera]EHJ13488.1 Anhydro-N-acetylmuramic acid kinase [Crocosphaera watsonii WH 0003]MCH2244979.1 anhydro-N-acetylmuramic acid kinase [Crocosphaera sp.]CCQ53718.1 Anhydro-N-acetylmuramic acid kinase [Crocosphaera watsonii WH 0005]
MYCLGLMSGTSVDSIDAALVKITGKELDLNIELLSGINHDYPDKLRATILEVAGGKPLSMEAYAQLDEAIALCFVEAVDKIKQNHPNIELIGSHGQTVYHRPPNQENIGYTLQLGRGEIIANLTGITTVNNFRVADIAAGGQGAPLVSKIDAYLLSDPEKYRCVQNIGGIGNVTYLPAKKEDNWQKKVMGWDTGPGNMLIDLAVQKFSNGEKNYDKNGEWAAQGNPYLELIEKWLKHDFFQQPPPKSTGRELFGADYLEQCWQDAQKYNLSETDFLATITDLTAASIAHNYQQFIKHPIDEILLCGGGSLNLYLKKRIQAHFPGSTAVRTTDEVGMNSDFKEAIAFAILAYWRYVSKLPGNLPQVTGAKQERLLGDIHYPL